MNWKWFSASLLVFLACFIGFESPRLFGNPSPSTNLVCEPGGCTTPQGFCSDLIWLDGTTPIDTRVHSSQIVGTAGLELGAFLNTNVALASGQTICFAPQSFTQSTTITIPSNTRWYFGLATIKLANSANVAMFKNTDWADTYTPSTIDFNIQMFGGIIDGNGFNNGNGGGTQFNGIFLRNTNNVLIQGMTIKNTDGDGIVVDRTSQNVTVTDNIFYNAGTGAVNNPNNNAQNAISIQGGLFSITNNKIFKPQGDCIIANPDITGGRDVIITGNDCEHGVQIAADAGISLETPNTRIDGAIVSNNIVRFGAPGIQIQTSSGTIPSTNVVVSSNLIVNSTQGIQELCITCSAPQPFPKFLVISSNLVVNSTNRGINVPPNGFALIENNIVNTVCCGESIGIAAGNSTVIGNYVTGVATKTFCEDTVGGSTVRGNSFDPIGVLTNPFGALGAVKTIGLNGVTSCIGSFGYGSNTANPIASTTYVADFSDLMWSCTGGTGVAILIKDPAGNNQQGGAGFACPNGWQFLPMGWQINFGAFSVAPTGMQVSVL